MEIINYRPINKGAMQGSVSFKLPITTQHGEFVMVIPKATVMMSNGRRWVNLPQEKYQDKEGQTKYFGLVQFEGEGASFKFSDAVLKELDAWIKKNPNGKPGELPKKTEPQSNSGYEDQGLPF